MKIKIQNGKVKFSTGTMYVGDASMLDDLGVGGSTLQSDESKPTGYRSYYKGRAVHEDYIPINKRKTGNQ